MPPMIKRPKYTGAPAAPFGFEDAPPLASMAPAMPDLTAGVPDVKPAKPGFFQTGGLGSTLAMAAGDALASYGGLTTNHMQQQQEDRADRLYERRSARDWEKFMRQSEYERAHPKPTINDTERDYEFYTRIFGPEKAKELIAQPEFIPTGNGQYMQIGGFNPSEPAPVAPPKPVGKLTPLGGSGSGQSNFPAMTGITAQAESGNRDYLPSGAPVTSPKGARYAMQVMPETARQPGYGISPAANDSPEEYNRVGREYLAAMMKLHGNDPARAWAAYNGGPGRLGRVGGNVARMPAETQNYVAGNVGRLYGRQK